MDDREYLHLCINSPAHRLVRDAKFGLPLTLVHGHAENKVPLTTEALAALAAASTLHKLSLFAGAVGDAGFTAVTAAITAGAWPVMQQLDIGGCELSSAAVSELFLALAAGAMPGLQVKPYPSLIYMTTDVYVYRLVSYCVEVDNQCSCDARQVSLPSSISMFASQFRLLIPWCDCAFEMTD